MIIAAKPTTYNGVNFRSRLEASWAAFFDLCGWRWEYEPVDLKGWVPDFYLYSTDGKPTPVEVKPIEWPVSFNDITDVVKNDAALMKVRRSQLRTVILGARPLPPIERGAPRVGIIYSPEYMHQHFAAVFATTAGKINRNTLCDTHPECDILSLNLCYEPTSYLYADRKLLYHFWKEARNLTQWCPSK